MLSVVCIDIDGTLIDSSFQIVPRVVDSIVACCDKGMRLVLGSGRPLESIQKVAASLPIPDYLIGLNGSISIGRADAAATLYGSLSEHLVAQLSKLSLELGFALCLYTVDKWYTAGPESLASIESNRSGLAPTQHFADVPNLTAASINEVVLKVLVIGEPKALRNARGYYSGMVGGQASMNVTYPEYLEFTPGNVSKANTLAVLLGKMGMGFGDVLAIGDSENDISLAARVATFVCMANASDDLKATSHYETTSNDEAGVAEALDGLILGKAEAIDKLRRLT